MKILKRLFLKGTTRQIIDNVATHTGYPQTENGLKKLGFSQNDIKKALGSKYIDEYEFPVASFGDGEDITYEALKLTTDGKKLAKTSNKNNEIRTSLFWWAYIGLCIRSWQMTQTVLLGDITTFLARGAAPKYTGIEDFYVINQKCIRDWRVSLDQARFTDTNVKRVTEERTLRAGDILVNSTGQGTLGRVGQFMGADRPVTVDSHVTIVRPDSNHVDVEFLGYALKGRESEIESMAEGSTGQTELSRLKLAALKLSLPDLESQMKIADILGTLDEKIELNRKMNETLEQMGQALFRHYFIDNPEVEKWGRIALGDRIKPRRGKSLQSKNMKPGDVPVVSGGLQPAGLHDESNTVAPVITISASGANAGFTALWGKNVWSADSSYIDTTITPHIYFYYIFLSRNQKRIYEMQTGSGQPHIYPSHIELLEMPNAPDEVVAQFNDEISASFIKIEENKKEIQTLTTLRNTLLPRLIRGKVKV